MACAGQTHALPLQNLTNFSRVVGHMLQVCPFARLLMHTAASSLHTRRVFACTSQLKLPKHFTLTHLMRVAVQARSDATTHASPAPLCAQLAGVQENQKVNEYSKIR